MLRSKLKIISLVLSIMLALSLLSSCTNAKESVNSAIKSEGVSKEDKTTDTSASKTDKDTESESHALTLPIVKDKITLTCFYRLDNNQLSTLTNLNEMEVYQELEKRTNIHIEWIHPAVGQDKEQLNLLIASKQMPDIIHYSLSSLPGGPAKALEDNTIIKLNDLIDKYAPNYKMVLSDPAVRKGATLDDGTIYSFGTIFAKDGDFGLIMRKDWLDNLNMQVPKTIDEIYEVLKAFREKDPNGNGDPHDELPMISSPIALVGAWGVSEDFYNENVVVKFGAIEPVYKDFLTEMNKWFNEKLIDPEYPITDSNVFNAKITNNLGGFWASYATLGMGRIIPGMQQTDPKFDLVGIPWPSGPSGKAYVTRTDYRGAAGIGLFSAMKHITSNNKHPIETTKWLDYHYSDEGRKLLIWGIEGKTFNMVNGQPEFTDLILNNPTGLTVNEALAKYVFAVASNNLVRDPRAWAVSYPMDQQKDAIKTWSEAETSLLLPELSVLPEESQKFASIMSEVRTFRDEMYNKFVMGLEPLSSFDNYVETIKKMGIDEAIQMMQAALERYNKR